MKLKLSPVKQISIHKLSKNKKNQEFFRSIDGGLIKQMKDDIEKRGILVPLIAKKNGVLLAGHRRLLCAQQLKMETVPVQYCLTRLTDEQETNFIIRDNLLRYHATPQERAALYRYIYDDFDDRLLLRGKPDVGVDIKKISKETGLNPKTVAYDITRMRYNKEREIASKRKINAPNISAIESYKKACARMLNIAMMDQKSTLCEFKKITESTLSRLRSMEDICVNLKPAMKRLK
jgi:hypothetical protein